MLNETLGKGEVNSVLDCFPEAHVFGVRHIQTSLVPGGGACVSGVG